MGDLGDGSLLSSYVLTNSLLVFDPSYCFGLYVVLVNLPVGKIFGAGKWGTRLGRESENLRV